MGVLKNSFLQNSQKQNCARMAEQETFSVLLDTFYPEICAVLECSGRGEGKGTSDEAHRLLSHNTDNGAVDLLSRGRSERRSDASPACTDVRASLFEAFGPLSPDRARLPRVCAISETIRTWNAMIPIFGPTNSVFSTSPARQRFKATCFTTIEPL